MSTDALRAQRLAFAYSDAVPLFEALDLQLPRGWTGLVGPNGAGKTTLLRLLAGELSPTSGSVDAPGPVLLCAQTVDAPDEQVRAFAESWEPEACTWRGRLELLPERLLDWARLSPGERKRWQVGAALASRPEVLLLDEPTNHLDAPARELLASALERFRGIGVLVSHDRPLLERLTTRTVRVANGAARLYPGAYGAAKALWEQERAEQAASWQASRDARQQLEKQLRAAREAAQSASRDRSAGRRMKDKYDSDARGLLADYRVEQAQKSHGKRVGALRSAVAQAGPEEPFPLEKELGGSLFVDFEKAPQPLVMVLDLPELRAGARRLLGPTRLDLKRDARLVLQGPNGSGKTTLLRAMLQACRVPEPKRLFLPQELSASEAREELEAVRALPPDARGRTLSLLATLGVDPTRLLASEQPSPGEARKLALARGLGARCQLLLLDEPTNHLDLPAIERLEAALAAFPGALVAATHDASFAQSLGGQTARIEGESLQLDVDP